MRIHSAKAQRWYRQESVELLIILRVAILLSLTAIGPMAECGFKRSIFLWDLTKGTELRRLGHRDVAGRMAFSPDGKLLAAAGCEDATVRIWDVQTGKELHVLIKHRIADGYPAAGLAFSLDGKVLATSCADK